MKKYKKHIIILIIIIIILNQINIPNNKLKIYFIDVGQGDSCLIITPKNKKILIDGGGSENYNIGENILIPYLLSRKINKIDYIMISHFDTDHCDGLLTVMEKLKVKKVIINKQIESENYKKFKKIIKEKKIEVIIVKKRR